MAIKVTRVHLKQQAVVGEAIEQYLKVTGVMTRGISAIDSFREQYKWTKLFLLNLLKPSAK